MCGTSSDVKLTADVVNVKTYDIQILSAAPYNMCLQYSSLTNNPLSPRRDRFHRPCNGAVGV